MRFDWMDEYAEFVLCEIKNPKYAERVKDEIVIHLQDLYADLLKQGLDQKAAQALSIQNMGDLKDLQRQYKQASRFIGVRLSHKYTISRQMWLSIPGN